MDLPILFEDDHLLVINKPSGVHSVMSAKSSEPSVAKLLTEKYAAIIHASLKPEDGGLVNRLDCLTSGILLAAKTRDSWLKLKNLLSRGGVKKTYLTLLEGKPPGPQIKVQSFIGTPHRRAKKVKVYKQRPTKSQRALPACSTFHILAYNRKLGVSLCRVELQTGRRHQIRAQAAFIGHPLLGDRLYGSLRSLQKTVHPSAPAFFLHAESMSFTHPFRQQFLKFEAPLPKWYKKISALFRPRRKK